MPWYLAAAIGVPLQSPDRGILAAVVIAIIVVSAQQLVAYLATKNQRLETITQGDVTSLIEDSRLNLDHVQKAESVHLPNFTAKAYAI